MIFRRLLRALLDPRKALKSAGFRYGVWNDFRLYRAGLAPYLRLLPPRRPQGPGLLIVAGNGTNVIWAQLWTLLTIPAIVKGYKPYVLLTPLSAYLKRYFALVGIDSIDLTKYTADSPALPGELREALDGVKSFDDFRRIYWNRMPIGDVALSTYCRNANRVMVDVCNPSVREELLQLLTQLWTYYAAAMRIYSDFDIQLAYFSEAFMEEYGSLYYAALSRDLNIIRFTGTVRDDALTIQHRDWDSERLHHAALAPSSWEQVKQSTNLQLIRDELAQNFTDRYGDKWYRSKRNQPGAKILEAADVRAQLGVADGRKIAVVYSHILYDTIFFFGTDLFADYATWLIETVKAAAANDKLEWYIKVHPSNIWRGELNTQLAGRYQEETLVEQHIGQLPPHVHIVPADSPISPLSWMQVADFGITVRGTSGLEMAAMGKTVITAGTGRYEGCGFTYDPPTKEAYLDLLGQLPDIAELTSKQSELAQRYAHAIFNLKPFTLSSMSVRLATGKTKVIASDDIVYVPAPFKGDGLPADLARFADFLDDRGRIDLLSEVQ